MQRLSDKMCKLQLKAKKFKKLMDHYLVQQNSGISDIPGAIF